MHARARIRNDVIQDAKAALGSRAGLAVLHGHMRSHTYKGVLEMAHTPVCPVIHPRALHKAGAGCDWRHGHAGRCSII